MDAETAITWGVIALALFLCVATIYAIGLSFSPRYARRDAIVTMPTLPQEILPIRQAREIIDICWDNPERKEYV